jgi:hypothetical protein
MNGERDLASFAYTVTEPDDLADAQSGTARMSFREHNMPRRTGFAW